MLHDYSRTGYFPTYHHVAPYALGTFVGFLILKHREGHPLVSNIPRHVQALMWFLAPAMSLSVMVMSI